MYRILLVDDDASVLKVNQDYLQKAGMEVVSTESLDEAMEVLFHSVVDCIVLDVMFDQQEVGFSFCEALKKVSDAPVVFLTCLDNEDALVKSFISGGDDYISKPYSLKELLIRIQARIASSRQSGKQDILDYWPLRINRTTREVAVYNEWMHLTHSEYEILLLLVENIGTVYSVAELYQGIWKMRDVDNVQTVQVHIAHLRKKLDNACPRHHLIETVWGKGYTFAKPEPGVEEHE